MLDRLNSFLSTLSKNFLALTMGQSKWVNITLAALIAINIYLVHGYIQSIPKLEPGQGKTEFITNPIVHVGEPIYVQIAIQVGQSQCNVVSERHIINSDGQAVYSKWAQIPHEALVKLDAGAVKLKVDLPPLPPGNYHYMSNVHLTCPGGISYLRTTDFLPFEIIK